jgi:hypothetical protein
MPEDLKDIDARLHALQQFLKQVANVTCHVMRASHLASCRRSRSLVSGDSKNRFSLLEMRPLFQPAAAPQNLARRPCSTFSSVYFSVTVPSNTRSNPRNMTSLQARGQRGDCLHLNDRMSCRTADKRAAAAALSPPAPKPCYGPTSHNEPYAARREKQIERTTQRRRGGGSQDGGRHLMEVRAYRTQPLALWNLTRVRSAGKGAVEKQPRTDSSGGVRQNIWAALQQPSPSHSRISSSW